MWFRCYGAICVFMASHSVCFYSGGQLAQILGLSVAFD